MGIMKEYRVRGSNRDDNDQCGGNMSQALDKLKAKGVRKKKNLFNQGSV